jgi:hypothetical protein
MFKYLLMLLFPIIIAPIAVAQTPILSFSEDRAPYDVLKELYDQAPRAARVQDFQTLDELRTTRKGMAILTKFFTGKGDEAFMITPELELSEVTVWKNNYLLNSKRRFVIEAGTPEQEAVPGKGPLFPAKPAVPAGKDVCGEVTVLWPMIDADIYNILKPNNCKSVLPGPSDKNPYEINMTQTDRDLIFSIGYKNKAGKIDARTTIFYRKSGDVIAMRIIAEKFGPAHSTIEAYNYAFNE